MSATVETVIEPLEDRVLVRRAQKEDVTPGGILLPEAAKERPREGVVLAVGPGAPLADGERREMHLEVGDRVLFTAYAGADVKVDGDELMLMREADVLAVVR